MSHGASCNFFVLLLSGVVQFNKRRNTDCFSPSARFLLPDIQAIYYCERRAAVRTSHQKSVDILLAGNAEFFPAPKALLQVLSGEKVTWVIVWVIVSGRVRQRSLDRCIRSLGQLPPPPFPIPPPPRPQQWSIFEYLVVLLLLLMDISPSQMSPRR